MKHTDIYINTLSVSGCDISLEADYGTISSPGYRTGDQYPNYLNCTVALLYNQDAHRTLIVEKFDTEENFDALEVSAL